MHLRAIVVRPAYIYHAQYLDERRTMMQWWASYSDALRASSKVVPLFAKAAND